MLWLGCVRLDFQHKGNRNQHEEHHQASHQVAERNPLRFLLTHQCVRRQNIVRVWHQDNLAAISRTPRSFSVKGVKSSANLPDSAASCLPRLSNEVESW